MRPGRATLMRILLANDSRADGGGVGTYLSSLVGPLVARGHAVALLHDGADASSDPRRIPVDQAWSIESAGLESSLAQARAWRPDVCFSHNMRALDVDEQLAREWPIVKMMHGYFGTCVSGQKAFAFPGARVCTRHCGPACLVHYLPRRCGYRNPATMLLQYDWASRQRQLFARYSRIVVASEHMRREYLAHGVGSDRVVAIPLFARSPERVVSAGTSIDVLFLGRLTPLKGGDLIVRAAHRVNEILGRSVTLTVAGDGPERARLDALATRLGVRATFPGWVDERGRSDLFATTRLVAIPSVWPEPFGLVGLEAAVWGIPSVAFDVGGISTWLSDGVNGRLVSPDEGAGGLADAIAGILRDPACYERLSRGARDATARFTSDAHLNALERVLQTARLA